MLHDVVPFTEFAPSGEPLPRLGYSAPDLVVEGEPIEYGHVYFDGRPGGMVAGIWESEAGTLRFEAYPFDEFCHVLSGEIVLLHEDGSRLAFGPGEAFVIRKGFKGLWHMPVKTKKYYVENHRGGS